MSECPIRLGVAKQTRLMIRWRGESGTSCWRWPCAMGRKAHRLWLFGVEEVDVALDVPALPNVLFRPLLLALGRSESGARPASYDTDAAVVDAPATVCPSGRSDTAPSWWPECVKKAAWRGRPSSSAGDASDWGGGGWAPLLAAGRFLLVSLIVACVRVGACPSSTVGWAWSW